MGPLPESSRGTCVGFREFTGGETEAELLLLTPPHLPLPHAACLGTVSRAEAVAAGFTGGWRLVSICRWHTRSYCLGRAGEVGSVTVYWRKQGTRPWYRDRGRCWTGWDLR